MEGSLARKGNGEEIVVKGRVFVSSKVAGVIETSRPFGYWDEGGSRI